MTKADTVAKRAEKRKVRKTVTARVLSVVIDSIVQAIKRGKKLMLTGFGTLFTTERKARKGRNPQTGKEIKIAARKVPKFTAGKALKDAVNGPAKKAAKAKKRAEAKPAALNASRQKSAPTIRPASSAGLGQ